MVLLFFPSPVGWCCLVSSFLGVVSTLSLCVVLLGLLFPWRCFPLLVRGAAWLLSSLGGLSCLVVLPSFSSFGSGCFLLFFFLGGVACSPFCVAASLLRWLGLPFLSFACCRLLLPSLGGVALFNLPLWAGVLDGATFPLSSVRVVLLGLLCWVVLLPVLPSSFGWGCFPFSFSVLSLPLLLGGAAFLFFGW